MSKYFEKLYKGFPVFWGGAASLEFCRKGGLLVKGGQVVLYLPGGLPEKEGAQVFLWTMAVTETMAFNFHKHLQT